MLSKLKRAVSGLVQPRPRLRRRRSGACMWSIERLESRALLSTITSTTLTPVNTSYIPGDGWNSLKFAPTGQLTQILWLGNELRFRRREMSGNWVDELVTGDQIGGDGFGQGNYEPYRDREQAQLIFASDGTPHVLMFAQNDSLQHYVRDVSGGWSLLETLPLPNLPGDKIAVFQKNLVAAAGSNNSLHVLTYGSVVSFGGPNPGYNGIIYYGTNKTGTWVFEQAKTTTQAPDWFHGFSNVWAPRHLSMAVDSQNFVHATVGNNYQQSPFGSGTRATSQLDYFTNRTGSWTSEMIIGPSDDSSDAGLSASIALGPGGQASVASFFAERVSTGSSQFSQLQYHVRQANGTWTHEVVASAPDGYVAGDGPLFTGFSPQLTFDSAGQPNIVFLDEAAQHFPNVGDVSFAGNLRRAIKSAGVWNLATVFRQSDPQNNVAYYPAVAVSPYEAAFSVVTQQDTPNGQGGYNTAFNTIFVSERFAADPYPTLTRPPGGIYNFLENSAPIVFLPGAGFGDPRSIGYDGATIVASIILNANAGDQLGVRNVGTAAGQVGVSGNAVSFGGTAIGTFSGGTGSTPLTITLNGSATAAAIQAVVRTLTFAASGSPISTVERVVRVVITDRDGIASFPMQQRVAALAQQGSPSFTRFYRAYNPNADYHFFTIAANEFTNAVNAGYRDESTGQSGFNVLTNFVAGATSIHRMYNLTTGRHYYTLNDFERDFLVSIGWKFEKDEGFMYVGDQPGMTQIYRLYNNNSGVHLYTESAATKTAVLQMFQGIWVEHSPLGFAQAIVIQSERSARALVSNSDSTGSRQFGLATSDIGLSGRLSADASHLTRSHTIPSGTNLHFGLMPWPHRAEAVASELPALHEVLDEFFAAWSDWELIADGQAR